MRTIDSPTNPFDVTAEVGHAVDILCRIPGVRRIWFFGSRATRTNRRGSDFDFAVEGLPKDAHFAALGDLMLTLHAPVDLVRWEETGNILCAEILRNGTVVYAT